VLLYESPVRAKLRPSNGSTAARIDDDVLVLLEIDRTYNEPLFLNTHIRIGCFVQSKSHLPAKQTAVPVLHTDRDVSGMLS
jgi:hypothetical protein